MVEGESDKYQLCSREYTILLYAYYSILACFFPLPLFFMVFDFIINSIDHRIMRSHIHTFGKDHNNWKSCVKMDNDN